MELSFKARADILGAPDYELAGTRSESLRLIESYTEFQKVLARIGLQTAGETRVSTEVPYPREIEAELPYNETYFEKHVLLMLLYPWETGYAAEDVTGVSRTGTVLTVSYTHLILWTKGGKCGILSFRMKYGCQSGEPHQPIRFERVGLVRLFCVLQRHVREKTEAGWYAGI